MKKLFKKLRSRFHGDLLAQMASDKREMTGMMQDIDFWLEAQVIVRGVTTYATARKRKT